MKGYSSHRSEKALLHDAAMHAAAERESQSKLLVDIAEIDARKVYREAGYDSIHSYCVQELGLSEKAAFHRIWVARVAWQFPCVLAALAEGRLHMSAVRVLAAHLTKENAEELAEAATHKTTQEIAELVTQRFPRPQEPTLALRVAAGEQTVAPTEPTEDEMSDRKPSDQHPLGGVEMTSPCSQETPCARLVPMPERFPLKVGLRRETHEKLRRAQDLLAHVVPSGDVAEVLDRALELLIRNLEKRKFAVTDRPRTHNHSARAGRTISAEIRRAVAERDGGQCTFVAQNGNRCLARRRLEFDHIQPIARGGRSTVANVRLLCRAHNQLMAELALGRDFIKHKLEHARERRAAAAAAKAAEEARALSAQLVSGLRRLGFNADESRRAISGFDGNPNASAEARMRAALTYLVPAQRRAPSATHIPMSP